MPEKQGKIKIVAKTGGIKLEGSDEWINPNPQYKQTLIDLADTVRGKNCKIILDSNGLICDVEPYTKPGTIITILDDTEPISRDEKIELLACLKAAVLVFPRNCPPAKDVVDYAKALHAELLCGE